MLWGVQPELSTLTDAGQAETPVHLVQARSQARTRAPNTLAHTRVPPLAGFRQPGMGLCPTTNVRVQDLSGHFPHFFPGLTLTHKLTLN